MKNTNRLFLTFDTEDFISENSILSLNFVLELLKKYELKALFFITGHMTERLLNFPNTVELLAEHQIGFHSSGHSVHPTIFEFTDVRNYQEAYQASLLRETSHINPLTGVVEGKGGILALKDLFPRKQIVAFRAPGHCWSPPHLEALNSLGINYDFSTSISSKPICYRNLTFYPYPIVGHWRASFSQYRRLILTLRRNISVLTIHPSNIVNRFDWDRIYYKSNPPKLRSLPARTPAEAASLFNKFEVLLKQIKGLEKINILGVTPDLEKAKTTFLPSPSNAEKEYTQSKKWAIIIDYTPQFQCQHFKQFFS